MAQWIAKGLEKYGLITVNAEGEAAQVEKVSYDTARRLLATFGKVRPSALPSGPSPCRHEMLAAMLKEFEPELNAKTAKMDSDPHFWMPLTLAKEAYCSVMVTKSGDLKARAAAHHDRMRAFRAALLARTPTADVSAPWTSARAATGGITGNWGCTSRITSSPWRIPEEAEALRDYLKIPESRVAGSELGACALAGGAIALACRVTSGAMHRTVASRVTDRRWTRGMPPRQRHRAFHPREELRRVQRRGRLGRRVGVARWRGVHQRVRPGSEKLTQTSSVTTDGGKVFKTKLTPNPFSFNEVYEMNKSVDVRAAYAEGAKAHADLAEEAPMRRVYF